MEGIDKYALGFSLILILSIVLKKVFTKFGFPSLLLFLGLGMLAGSEGVGGIYFDDFQLAYSIGSIALVFILYSSGLQTDWERTRPVLLEGLALSTLGIAIATTVIGAIVFFLLRVSLLEGLLLGAILSSTDASAISFVIKSTKISTNPRISALLNLESGSNDPMAVFCTLTLIHIIVSPMVSFVNPFFFLLKEIFLGALAGMILGKCIPWFIVKLELNEEGLDEVFSMGGALLAYAVTASCQGSGFLASYIAGIVVSKQKFPSKENIIRFHESITWLIEITMFVTLGLLVFPSKLIQFMWPGLLIAILSIVIARPFSVLTCMALSEANTKEKLFISWLGLKGGVTIILGIFPLVYNIPRADILFNIVFFTVIASITIQQPLANLVGRTLGFTRKKHYTLS